MFQLVCVLLIVAVVKLHVVQINIVLDVKNSLYTSIYLTCRDPLFYFRLLDSLSAQLWNVKWCTHS